MNATSASGAIPLETVIHVFAPWTADPQLVANEAGAAWVAAGAWKSRQVSSVAYTTITVQPFDGVTAPLTLNVTGYTGVSGTIATAGVSINACMLVTKRTLLAGRSYRGRMYVPGGPISDALGDGSGWTSTGVTNIQGAANAWKTKLEAGPTISHLMVYSPFHGTATSVAQLVARPYFGSQRRRSSPY
jgi:hypothetical protein